MAGNLVWIQKPDSEREKLYQPAKKAMFTNGINSTRNGLRLVNETVLGVMAIASSLETGNRDSSVLYCVRLLSTCREHRHCQKLRIQVKQKHTRTEETNVI